jgi:hypothetical protein
MYYVKQRRADSRAGWDAGKAEWKEMAVDEMECNVPCSIEAL